jgi:hypothetical protein
MRLKVPIHDIIVDIEYRSIADGPATICISANDANAWAVDSGGLPCSFACIAYAAKTVSAEKVAGTLAGKNQTQTMDMMRKTYKLHSTR